MSRDLGRDVPDLEQLYAGKLWANFSYPKNCTLRLPAPSPLLLFPNQIIFLPRDSKVTKSDLFEHRKSLFKTLANFLLFSLLLGTEVTEALVQATVELEVIIESVSTPAVVVQTTVTSSSSSTTPSSSTVCVLVSRKAFSSKRGLFFTVKGPRALPKFHRHHPPPPCPSPPFLGFSVTPPPPPLWGGAGREGGGGPCGIWGARKAPLPWKKGPFSMKTPLGI